MTEFTQAGILTTASDLVFTGGNDGYFLALNARTGALLWKFTAGGAVVSGPMTYSVGGRRVTSRSPPAARSSRLPSANNRALNPIICISDGIAAKSAQNRARQH